MSLFAKMPYDQVRDLAAITRIGMMPNILTAHPLIPIRTFRASPFKVVTESIG
jgi:hypothetical protein